MFLQRCGTAPLVAVDPLQRLARKQTQRIHHLIHFYLRSVPRVDPVHAVEGDAGARAVNVVDEEFADEDRGVGVAFSYAGDHFARGDGDAGYAGDGEGLGGSCGVSRVRRGIRGGDWLRVGRRSLCRRGRGRDIRRGRGRR